MELQPYNFAMIHKPGSSMKKTDILSRREEYEAGKDDNKDIVLLEAKHFARPITITPLPDDIIARIRAEARNQDGSVTKALAERKEGWQKEDDLVTFEGHIYVPKSKELRDDLIRRHHDTPLAGHPGHSKTLELITRNYYWPKISQDVRSYVGGCNACQRTKP